MRNRTLQEILSWMRGTDLIEVAYRRGSEGFELRLEGASPAPDAAFPASRYVPVASPGVGVFRFGAPGKPRRAEEGAVIAVDDALGIVETGGKNIEVTAGTAGRLAKILIDNGSPVEYGQLLFLLSP